MTTDPQIKVLDIHVLEGDSELTWGFAIDEPSIGTQYPTRGMLLKGWVLGKQSPVQQIDIISGHQVFCSVGLNDQRLDIATIYPQVPEAEYSGFMAEIELVGLPIPTELTIEALLVDQTRVLLGTIQLSYVIQISAEVEQDLLRSQARLKQARIALEQTRTKCQQIVRLFTNS